MKSKNSPYVTSNYSSRIAPRSVQQNRQNSTKSEKKEPTSIKRARTPKKLAPIPTYLPKSTDRPKKREISTAPNQNLLDDAHCIEIREQLFEKGNIEDFSNEELQKELIHLREYYISLSSERNYSDAKKSTLLYQAIKDELAYRDASSSEIPTDPEETYQDVKMKNDEKHQKELDDFDAIADQRIQELDHKQTRAREKFEEDWHDKYPQKYQKPSSKLLGLYEIERRLGMTGDFDQAAIVKQQALELQEQEMEIAQSKLLYDYEKHKRNFDLSQKEEKDILINSIKHERECIVSRQKVENDYLANREIVLHEKEREKSTFKPRETSQQIQAQSISACGNTVQLKRQNKIDTSKILLPPLIPPNDEKMKHKLEEKKKQRLMRNKQIKKQLEKRQKEEDCSDSEFDTASQKSHPRENSPNNSLYFDSSNITEPLDSYSSSKAETTPNSKVTENSEEPENIPNKVLSSNMLRQLSEKIQPENENENQNENENETENENTTENDNNIEDEISDEDDQELENEDQDIGQKLDDLTFKLTQSYQYKADDNETNDAEANNTKTNVTEANVTETNDAEANNTKTNVTEANVTETNDAKTNN